VNSSKRQGQASIGLFVLEVLLLANLGRWLTTQEAEIRLVLGLHLFGLVIILGVLLFIRRQADPVNVWPEDLDNVWEDDEAPVIGCERWRRNVAHEEHTWTADGETGFMQCPGVPGPVEEEPDDVAARAFAERRCSPDGASVPVHHMISPDDGRCQCGEVTAERVPEFAALLTPKPEEPTEVLEPVDLDPPSCTNRRFHAAHDGCPGRSGKRKVATS